MNAPATAKRAAKPVAPAPGGPDGVAVAMGLAFAFMWSSAFTSAKIALADAPPFLLLGARFALAGLVAVAIAALAGQKLPKDRRAWTLIALFGFCQNSLYLGLNFLAMTTIPAGLAAIIASSLPLLVAAIDRVFFGARLPWLGVLGLLAGFAGVLVIMGGRIAGGVDPVGLALCLVGALALAAATLIVRAMTAGGGGGGGLMAVGLQMLVGAVTLAPVGLIFESLDDVRPTLSLGLAFAYTAIIPGVVATLVWFRLVARIGATAASAFHFLNPAFGVGVAALMLGEAVGWMDAAGVAVVTLGIAAVQWARLRG